MAIRKEQDLISAKKQKVLNVIYKRNPISREALLEKANFSSSKLSSPPVPQRLNFKRLQNEPMINSEIMSRRSHEELSYVKTLDTTNEYASSLSVVTIAKENQRYVRPQSGVTGGK